MILDLFRGVGLWLLVIAAVAVTGWAAYQLGLIPVAKRMSDRPFVLLGFALGGLITLGIFIAVVERAFQNEIRAIHERSTVPAPSAGQP